jgi:hypothetical protein
LVEIASFTGARRGSLDILNIRHIRTFKGIPISVVAGKTPAGTVVHLIGQSGCREEIRNQTLGHGGYCNQGAGAGYGRDVGSAVK